MSNNYTSKDIQTLSDLDSIRQKTGMYIGETKNPAHLFQEVIDNAMDESIAGYASKVSIRIDTENKMYEVRDNGRGFPMGDMQIEIMGHIFTKPSLELLVSKTHTGGKLGGGKNYSTSAGTHGVGLKCLSALSELFEVETFRVHDDTNEFTQGYISFSRGKLVEQTYTKSAKKQKGSIVRFKADHEIFESIEIPTYYIITKCKLIKAFGHQIQLIIDNEEADLGDGGLQSLLSFDDSEPITDYKEVVVKIEDEFARFGIQYGDDISYSCKGFSNMLYTSQGGTHVRLYEKAIIKAWRLVVDKDTSATLKDNDFLIGCRSLVACFINSASYSSQTKERLVTQNSLVQPLIDLFVDEFTKFLRNNKDYVSKLTTKFLAYRRAQNAMLSSKEIRGSVKVAEVSSDGKVRRRSVVPGLVECTNPIVGETEIFITEGDSALGSIRQARDSRIHSGLALRGKCLNVAGMDFVSAMRNQEMLNIVNAIGAGIGEESDPSKSRYGKIIITADSDMDGLHIQNLVVSALINLVPNLVKAGMVYIAPGYLYGYYKKDGSFHGCNTFDEVPKDAKRYSRFKGLGELNPPEFFKFYMDKKDRYLQRVNFPESLEEFNRVMIQSKKSLLEEEGVIIYNR